MPNLGDLSNYIKTKELKTGDMIKFKEAGAIVEKDFEDGKGLKKLFQVNVSLNGGDPKEMTLNATSRGVLADAWGYETEEWIGREAKVTFMKGLVFGKPGEILVLQPTEEEVK